jgi:hypothetical protein
LEESSSVGTSPKHLYNKNSALSHPECVKLAFPVVFWLISGHFVNRLKSRPMSLNNRIVLNDDSGRAWKKALTVCFKVKGKVIPVQAMKA